MAEPNIFWQITGRVAFEFAQVQHLIPTYLHIILAALFPIYTAAHSSLSRPSSAAKPPKKQGPEGRNKEDDDEEERPRMEGLSKTDAILFPVIAGIMLAALYVLIKWDKELLNKLLGWYFGLAGTFGVIKFLSDAMHILHSFAFPSFYSDGSGVWNVDQENRVVARITAEEQQKASKASPLPGLLSHLPLPSLVLSSLWTMRAIPQEKLIFKLYIKKIVSIRTNVDLYHFLSLLIGGSAVGYFTFVDKPWYLTNLMGFAFSYTALQLISPTSFTTGSLILAGLFIYDIYMVFFTPLMVTVAKNLDIPVKLMFPRPAEDDEGVSIPQYAMLGLGDIVLPGIVMGLALRFDIYLHYLHKQTTNEEASTDSQKAGEVVKPRYVSPSRNWANHIWTTSWLFPAAQQHPSVPDAGQFSKTYFHASVFGYIVGMIATLAAMHISSHPQPALLYLVPGVLGSLWLTALFRREVSAMWDFTELEDEEDEDDTNVEKNKQTSGDVKEPKPKKSQPSILSSSHDARRATEWSKAASKFIQADEDGTPASTKLKDDATRELISFSMSKLSTTTPTTSVRPSSSGSERKRSTDGEESAANWIAPAKEQVNGEPAGKRLRTR